jgi:8-oxo-dGTP diphosphatase
MDRKLGVAGKAIVRKADRILLLKRAALSSHDPGLWELPGGKMDSGEVLTEALAREVREETGLMVSVGHPILTWHFVKEPFWVTGVTFVCDYVDGEIELSNEHSEARWMTPAEALALPLSTQMKEQIEAYIGTGART